MQQGSNNEKSSVSLVFNEDQNKGETLWKNRHTYLVLFLSRAQCKWAVDTSCGVTRSASFKTAFC